MKEMYVTNRQTDRQTDKQMSQNRRISADEIRRYIFYGPLIIFGLGLLGLTLNRSIFDEDMREKRFLRSRSQ